MTLFPVDQIVSAFRFMSQRNNIGKVVVSISQPAETTVQMQPTVGSGDAQLPGGDTQTEQSPIRPDGSYLITGGLGSLRLATARWLSGQGAGGVMLMSRRAANSFLDGLAEYRNSRGWPTIAIN